MRSCSNPAPENGGQYCFLASISPSDFDLHNPLRKFLEPIFQILTVNFPSIWPSKREFVTITFLSSDLTVKTASEWIDSADISRLKHKEYCDDDIHCTYTELFTVITLQCNVLYWEIIMLPIEMLINCEACCYHDPVSCNNFIIIRREHLYQYWTKSVGGSWKPVMSWLVILKHFLWAGWVD